jgi:hypothetical protein
MNTYAKVWSYKSSLAFGYLLALSEYSFSSPTLPQLKPYLGGSARKEDG